MDWFGYTDLLANKETTTVCPRRRDNCQNPTCAGQDSTYINLFALKIFQNNYALVAIHGEQKFCPERNSEVQLKNHGYLKGNFRFFLVCNVLLGAFLKGIKKFIKILQTMFFLIKPHCYVRNKTTVLCGMLLYQILW